MMAALLPPKELFELLVAVEDSCDFDRSSKLVEEFLMNLEQSETSINDLAAIERLPGAAFGGAFRSGETFTINAAEASKVLSYQELKTVGVQLQIRGDVLRKNKRLLDRFPNALRERS